MTLTLRLGVIDVPYPNDKEGTSTGDVAEILEAKYGVMDVFYQNNKQAVADDVASGFAGTLESLMMGAPVREDTLFASGETQIDTLFKQWLSSGAIEGLGISGVPTKAAQGRRSLRHKNKINPRPRPSFIDTGLYESSFKSEVLITGWDKVTEAAARAYQGGA